MHYNFIFHLKYWLSKVQEESSWFIIQLSFSIYTYLHILFLDGLFNLSKNLHLSSKIWVPDVEHGL